MKHYKGFTLTEVLLAVAIVGIIAALVLPALITQYQNKTLNQKYQRETQTIENTIDGLAAAENKGSFFETVMYTDEEPKSYKDTSEEFLKKYMRVSKLCGDNNGDCFAKTYYEYKDNDKIVYTPTYKGSCAILKNGSSICITPQVVNTGVSGIIDLNGTKGPNVLGKDLREFMFDYKTRRGVSKATGDVADTTFLVDIKENNPCETDQFGLPCCILHTDEIGEGQPYRECCKHPEIEATWGETCKKTPDPDPCELDPYSVECCKTQDPANYKNNKCCTYTEIKNAYPEYCTTILVELSCLINEKHWFGVYKTGMNCVLSVYGTSDKFLMYLYNGFDKGRPEAEVLGPTPGQNIFFYTIYPTYSELTWKLINKRTNNSIDADVKYDGNLMFNYKYEGPNF